MSSNKKDWVKFFRRLSIAGIIGLFSNILISIIYEFGLKKSNIFCNIIEFFNKNKNIFWPYGKLGCVVLSIAIPVAIITISINKSYPNKKFNWIEFLLLISVTFLIIWLGVLIFVAQDTSSLYWIWTDVIIWTILFISAFYRYDQAQDQNNNSKDTHNKVKGQSNNKKNSKKYEKYWYKIKNKIIKLINRFLALVSVHYYLIKRLLSALVASTIELIFFSIYFSVKFPYIKSRLNLFLHSKTSIDQTANFVICNMGAAIFIGLPIIILIIALFKVYALSQEQSNTKYIINNNIEIQKDKTWLQAISFLSWLIAIMLTFLNIIPTWVKLKNLDAHMLYYLWFVLFAISLIIIYFLSEIMDWLKKDSFHHDDLPRTTMFLGFVASLLAAVISIFKG